MIIPEEPPISAECTDLIQRLLTYDSEERISWNDFFNHAIFEKDLNTQDMKSSVMFRTHSQNVSKLFNRNKKTKPANVDLVDPLEIELQEGEAKASGETEEKKVERALRKARRRYTHEKKIIVFIMHTCRKLRNLAKQTNDF